IGQAPPALEHGYRLVEELLKGHHPPSLCRCGVQQTVWEEEKPSGAFILHMVDKRKQEVARARDAEVLGKDTEGLSSKDSVSKMVRQCDVKSDTARYSCEASRVQGLQRVDDGPTRVVCPSHQKP